MPQGPAARITDPVLHLLPGILTPGPGSFNTMIGMLPAWRGIPSAAVGGLQAAKTASNARITAAEVATAAATGPAYPAAKAAEMTLKGVEATAMAGMITGASAGADIHLCISHLPVPIPPPHGPGVVIDGSPTVFINNLPACRLGDTILEAFGPPNKIVMGCPTVIIGQRGGGGGAGLGGGVGMPVVDKPCLGSAASSGSAFVRV